MRVIDFLDTGARLGRDRICITDGTRTLTYADAQALTHRIAHALRRDGIAPGDGVAIWSPNDVVGYVCGLGLNRAEALWIPLNARNAIDDIVWHLQLGRCRALLYHGAFEEELEKVRSQVAGLDLVVRIDGPGAHPSLEDWLEGVPNEPVPPPARFDPEAVFRVTLTGGTTGRPKGVMQTHRMAETNIASLLACLRYEAPPVYLCAAPMTHAAGVTGFHALALGGTIVMLDKPEAGLVLEAIARHRANALIVPPTVLYAMLSHPKAGETDTSSLRYFFFGTAPMSAEKLKEAIDRFGPMAQIYGQTEASLMITYFPPDLYAEARRDPAKAHRLLSCGRAGPLCSLEIMDDEGRLLPDGERGEIVLRSGLVMKGYVDDPDSTARVSEHGWHHTGDVGYRDPDGFVYLVDRKRDLIISGGFNVFPSEVEQVIWGHPAVQDCAVIGVPDEKWGEAVKAVVELKPGQNVTADEIIALCKAKLGSVKAPKTVEFWDTLPKSALGKVLKRDVRERFWQGRERRI